MKNALMKNALKSFAPRWLKQGIKARLAAQRAAAFRKAAVKEALEATAAAVCDSRLEFCAGQREKEIVGFLKLACEVAAPTVIGEIGSSNGGNLLLFSSVVPPGADLFSVELVDDPVRRAAYRSLVSPAQRLLCISGDSHLPATRQRVADALGGRRFDLLFIDGDHSYEGVKADFEMYAPLVRDGGLIGFHDIVADVFQRYGRPTPSVTGGVPTYWREVKQRFPEHWEFVDDPEQDGFGIGAVRWRGAF